MKIETKKNWHRSSPPREPSAPRKPDKTVNHENWVSVFTSGPTYDFNLSDVSVPNGMELRDLFVRVLSGSYDDGSELEFGFYEKAETEVDSKTYAEQMKRYEVAYAKYADEKERHRAEVAEWKLWVKQEDAEDLERNLKRAEDLLRKNGRLK